LGFLETVITLSYANLFINGVDNKNCCALYQSD